MNLNFAEICRLCLRICEEYVDLNQTNGVKSLADDLVEKIKFCYFVQVDLSEGFPTKVCYECIQVLSFFYTAKSNVISCDKLLRDILFVRKKLEEDTKSHIGETVTSPDIIKIKQDKEKTRPIFVEPKNKEPKKCDLSDVKVKDVKNGHKCVNNSEISISPIIDTEREIFICDIDRGSNLALNKHLKVKKRKKLEQFKQSVASSDSAQNNTVAKLLTPANSNLKDYKKEQSQRGKTSHTTKDAYRGAQQEFNPEICMENLYSGTAKNQLELDPPLKENVVKEIGTVIDTNNILSPNVKRTRKSILAR